MKLKEGGAGEPNDARLPLDIASPDANGLSISPSTHEICASGSQINEPCFEAGAQEPVFDQAPSNRKLVLTMMHCEKKAANPGECGYTVWARVAQAMKKYGDNGAKLDHRLRPCIGHGWAPYSTCCLCKKSIWEISDNGKIIMAKFHDRTGKRKAQVVVSSTGELLQYSLDVGFEPASDVAASGNFTPFYDD